MSCNKKYINHYNTKLKYVLVLYSIYTLTMQLIQMFRCLTKSIKFSIEESTIYNINKK